MYIGYYWFNRLLVLYQSAIIGSIGYLTHRILQQKTHIHRICIWSIEAGDAHTILVRDDGLALAFGDNDQGQCDIPPIPAGERYILVVY